MVDISVTEITSAVLMTVKSTETVVAVLLISLMSVEIEAQAL